MRGERLEGAGRNTDLAVAWFEVKGKIGEGERRALACSGFGQAFRALSHRVASSVLLS